LDKNLIDFSQIFYVNKEWIEFDEINTYKELEKLFGKQKIDINKLFFV
jgi:hypothetical protein